MSTDLDNAQAISQIAIDSQNHRINVAQVVTQAVVQQELVEHKYSMAQCVVLVICKQQKRKQSIVIVAN